MDGAQLEGAVCLVTGGGRGIGREIALALARAGGRIAVVARTTAEIDAVAAECRELGATTLAVAGDLGSGDVEQITTAVVESLGSIDLLVNNAGMTGPAGPLWSTDMEEWWHCFEVNLRAPALLSRAVLPDMVRRGQGRIVNVASGAGARAWPHNSSYGVSKTALIRFTETVAAEVRDHGVQVFALAPGLVRTKLTDDVLASEAGARWFSHVADWFREGHDRPAGDAANLVVEMASGTLDALTGCLIAVADDRAELLSHHNDIADDSLYRLRIRRLPEEEE